MKKGARVLAINDSPFRLSDREARVIGVLGRLDAVEGVLSFSVRVDGDDATDAIIRSLRGSRFGGQARVLALNGTVLAGLNAVDMQRIKKELSVEPLAITRRRPHPALLQRVARLRLGRARAASIKRLNGLLRIEKTAGYYVQRLEGAERPSAEMVGVCVSLLRLAHLVASGVARGESRGRI